MNPLLRGMPTSQTEVNVRRTTQTWDARNSRQTDEKADSPVEDQIQQGIDHYKKEVESKMAKLQREKEALAKEGEHAQKGKCIAEGGPAQCGKTPEKGLSKCGVCSRPTTDDALLLPMWRTTLAHVL